MAVTKAARAHFVLRIDARLNEKLQKAADKKRVSKNQYIENLLREKK